ncbi:MAG: hypothetical protein NT022_01035 [Deltaproteobacteria bacterium]|nr:hypothetical protein [Deltaproteobacteria bacterium]
MQIREHRGFNIEVYKSGAAYVLGIYRIGKLIRNVHYNNNPEGQFRSPGLLIEAAREWIDRTYPPGKIKYFGEV